MIGHYRRLQLLNIIMNDIFSSYLICSHAVFLFIVSMLFFGVIGMWRIDPLANLMYPLCGARCGFEALTPLDTAGKMHLCSRKLLGKWKVTVSGIDCGEMSQRLVMQHQRSLKCIQCKAGSFYTFENSTVINSIDNGIQLTVNLLVMFE